MEALHLPMDPDNKLLSRERVQVAIPTVHILTSRPQRFMSTILFLDYNETVLVEY